MVKHNLLHVYDTERKKILQKLSNFFEEGVSNNRSNKYLLHKLSSIN